MGDATIGGLTFRIDPSSISLGYSIKTNVKNTVGGRVIQVLGTKIDNLTVKGSVGIGGYTEHRNLVKNMLYLAEKQLEDRGTPMMFTYPPEDWQFRVYLTGIKDGVGGPAISITPGKTDWGFTLTMFVVSDNANLKQAATDEFIKHFSVGIGWTPTEYNGIATYAGLVEAQSDAAAAEANSAENRPNQAEGGN